MSLRTQASEYVALCEFAERLGIDTSLDAPGAPTTVAGLHELVALACEDRIQPAKTQDERERWQRLAHKHWSLA